jgi:hypothetical protein
VSNASWVDEGWIVVICPAVPSNCMFKFKQILTNDETYSSRNGKILQFVFNPLKTKHICFIHKDPVPAAQ